MPIRGSGAGPVDGARVAIDRQSETRWRPAPALDQVRQDRALLRRGQSGEAVRQLQQMLNASGAQLDVDGLFGPATEQAVQRFQAQQGLDPDRLVGSLTLSALERGGSVEAADGGDARRARAAAVGTGDRLAGAAERAPTLGAEAPAGRTGVHGLLSAGTRLTRGDIDWDHPAIRPPGGQVTQPSPQAFAAAVKAYDEAVSRGEVRNHKMTLIDFSQPSTEPRMWVIDMDSKRLLAQHRVAHGSGSGDPRDARMASSFSNRSGSHQSSLGTYITAETYQGNHGRSLKLDGKETGFNSQARSRAIVMHEADYASDDFVRRNGYLGRSQGCPALDPAVAQDVIDLVKGGSAMLIYAEDQDYLRRSSYLNR
ncbi:MAG: murein L,D-transpeptidase catalytic domain family protein [Deltaproteobacteria bacterium]|nr:murein L,D-transpeptidase catalytic domain family protein [Deltaproteobacteria bacterium]